MLRGLVCDYGGVLTDFGSPARAEPPLLDALRGLRGRGIRTALLSNAGRGALPQGGIRDLFDAVLLSGEVGLAKPDPQIFQLAAERLGLSTQECVFVDDLPGYVRAAVATGMVGVHHRSPRTTIAELDILFGD